MPRKLLLPVLLAAALTACAPAAAPASISPTDVGATALALANSMLTQTPSFGGNSQPPPYAGATDSGFGTPVPVTGLSGVLTNSTPAQVDCNHPLNMTAAGKGVRLAIKNASRGEISLTLGVASPNSQGRCGWLSLLVPKDSKAVLQVPETRLDLGDVCYWASAMITDRGFQASVAGKDFCIVSGAHWILNVSDTGISLSAP